MTNLQAMILAIITILDSIVVLATLGRVRPSHDFDYMARLVRAEAMKARQREQAAGEQNER